MILYAVSIGMSHKECPLFTENSSDSNVPSKKRFIHLLPQFHTCDLFGQNSLGQQSLGCWEARLHVSVSKKRMHILQPPSPNIKKKREKMSSLTSTIINHHQPTPGFLRHAASAASRFSFCLLIQLGGWDLLLL